MSYNDNEPMTSIYFEKVEHVIYVGGFAISTVIVDDSFIYNHTCTSMDCCAGTYIDY